VELLKSIASNLFSKLKRHLTMATTKIELQEQTGLSMSALRKAIFAAQLEDKDLYAEDETNLILQEVERGKSSTVPTKRNAQQSQPSGSIVTTSQQRTALSKRKAVEQAAQDAAIANRAYAETYLTVLNHGAEEFIQSLTQHSDGLRESLSEVEDDADFLAGLIAGGCGGALPE
jgi:hypothetical protein